MGGADAWFKKGTEFNGLFSFGDPPDQKDLPEKPPKDRPNNEKCKASPSSPPQDGSFGKPNTIEGISKAMRGEWRRGKKGKAVELGADWVMTWMFYWFGKEQEDYTPGPNGVRG
jgi:hypothetical protein